MGREVRRVPIDFDHPLHAVWPGFVPPDRLEAGEEADFFVPVPPPEGPGWQVWETVSEGSPISPVFATREDLIDWIVGPGAGYMAVGGRRVRREAAEAFVDLGSVPSFTVLPDGTVASGVEVADAEKARVAARKKPLL